MISDNLTRISFGKKKKIPVIKSSWFWIISKILILNQSILIVAKRNLQTHTHTHTHKKKEKSLGNIKEPSRMGEKKSQAFFFDSKENPEYLMCWSIYPRNQEKNCVDWKWISTETIARWTWLKLCFSFRDIIWHIHLIWIKLWGIDKVRKTSTLDMNRIELKRIFGLLLLWKDNWHGVIFVPSTRNSHGRNTAIGSVIAALSCQCRVGSRSARNRTQAPAHVRSGYILGLFLLLLASQSHAHVLYLFSSLFFFFFFFFFFLEFIFDGVFIWSRLNVLAITLLLTETTCMNEC